jgi:4-hydroxy-tetrahydrodipicolinate synthase
MILSTPFTDDGAVDWDDLAREARFVNQCGAQGAVWPQGSSRVSTLTKAERLKGMELLATTMRGGKGVLVLGVQGRDTAEMLDYARAAEALAPDAMIAMPPRVASSLDDYREYFRALAKVTTRPVILQTTGGVPALTPSVDLMVGLAREYPHLGYIKEESEPVVERMKAELEARPPLTHIFGATFGTGWLYEMRLGLDGVITGNAMYADVMARLWELHVRRDKEALRDLYGRFLLMRNLREQIAGADLYVLKKRGIFKSATTRLDPKPGAGPAESPRVQRLSLTRDEVDEIEYRYAALAPYLSSITPS